MKMLTPQGRRHLRAMRGLARRIEVRRQRMIYAQHRGAAHVAEFHDQLLGGIDEIVCELMRQRARWFA